MSLGKRLYGIPTYIVVVVLVMGGIIIGGSAVLIYKQLEPGAQADTAMPLAARVDQTDGNVGIDHQLNSQTTGTPATTPPTTGGVDTAANSASTNWEEATRNTPVSVGDRLYVRQGS
ncbi:MAG TPA: hypothetical protein VJX67_05915, partial [Blastocatellia bacterium]|nr:hypothetical protein [Blastocatellia bacterium]